MASPAAEENLRYYQESGEGVRDYWRYMAAPRHRVGTLRRLIAEQGPQSIVDLGCGDGSLLRVLAARLPQAKYCGIDLSANQIERNRRDSPETAWVLLDLDREGVELGPELDRTFDAVVASEVIEHVDHPEWFLRHARALAGTKGRLYLSTQSGPVRATERLVGHRRHFAVAEMEELLRAAGWASERVWNTGFPFHDLSKWWANRNPERTMRNFGGDRYGLRQRLVCLVLRGLFAFNSERRGAQLFAVARAT